MPNSERLNEYIIIYKIVNNSFWPYVKRDFIGPAQRCSVCTRRWSEVGGKL